MSGQEPTNNGDYSGIEIKELTFKDFIEALISNHEDETEVETVINTVGDLRKLLEPFDDNVKIYRSEGLPFREVREQMYVDNGKGNPVFAVKLSEDSWRVGTTPISSNNLDLYKCAVLF